MKAQISIGLMTLLMTFTAAAEEAVVDSGNQEIFEPGESNDKNHRKNWKKRKEMRQKLGKMLEKHNPELFKSFQDARLTWKDLNPEQRKQARQNWIETNPEAKALVEKMQARRGMGGGMRELKEKNPALFEKWRTAQQSWSSLNREDRQAARKAFLDANPELKSVMESRRASKGKKSGIRELKSSDPVLFEKMKDHRKAMRDLTPEDRKIARQKFLEENPGLGKNFGRKSRSKKR